MEVIQSENGQYKVKKKFKKGVFSWQSAGIKIEFSDGGAELCGDMMCAKNLEDVFSFNYAVRLFRKYKNKWKLVAEGRTYDFPSLYSLYLILNDLLDRMSPDDKVSCAEYRTPVFDESVQVFHMETRNWGNDDFYAVKKVIEEDETVKVRYSLFAGVDANPCDTASTYGVHDTFISQEGMQLLYDCIEGFLNHTKNNANKCIMDEIEARMSSYCFYDGIVLQIGEDGEFENIFTVQQDGGMDKLSIISIDWHNDKEYKIYTYDEAEIKGIAQDGIIISAKTCKVNGAEREIMHEGDTVTIVLPYKQILYIFEDPYEGLPKLSYGTNHIAYEFLRILPEHEKALFAIHSEDILFKRWKEVLIERYFMFRDEHHFPKVQGGIKHPKVKYDNREDSIAAIMDVIKEVKRLCRTELWM